MGTTMILALVGWQWPEGWWGSMMQDPSSWAFIHLGVLWGTSMSLDVPGTCCCPGRSVLMVPRLRAMVLPGQDSCSGAKSWHTALGTVAGVVSCPSPQGSHGRNEIPVEKQACHIS